jgi:exopolysaccharide biosynthesis WecB/TagA/CpsF family protein/anti-anti-sigma factor
MIFHGPTMKTANSLVALKGVGYTILPRAAKAPPIALLGIPFDNVTLAEAAQQIESMIASRQPHHVVTANVDFLVLAMHDTELRDILIDAHLVLCDGTPLVWASQLLGNPLPERVAGSDLVPLLIHLAAERKYRLFFLGATPESNAKAVANVRTQFPGAIISGHYSPEFRAWNAIDNEDIARRIRAARPDILLVAFGCPKAEKWIAQNYLQLGVPVAIGVGATIDFLAGNVRRAPRWMQRAGMEWFYRLTQEPKRLLRRYARDLWYFTGGMIEQLWLTRFSPREAHPRLQHCVVNAEQNWERIQLPRRFDANVVRHGDWIWRQAGRRHCLLDFSAVRFVDSTGIALLLRLQKKFRASGKRLRVFAPGRAVLRVLRRMRLQKLFFTAQNVADAQGLAARRHTLPQYHHRLPVREPPPVPPRLDRPLRASHETSWRITTLRR